MPMHIWTKQRNDSINNYIQFDFFGGPLPKNNILLNIGAIDMLYKLVNFFK